MQKLSPPAPVEVEKSPPKPEDTCSPESRDRVISQESPKKRGPPLKYDSLDRLKLALQAKLGISLGTAGLSAAIQTSKSIEEIVAAKGASRHTVVQALAELAECLKFDLAKKLAHSTSLNVMLDATTDNARELLAIHFCGVGLTGKWKQAVGVLEISGHKAADQVTILHNVLIDLNTYQRKLKLKETKLYDVTSLTTDNTSSNTGEKGLKGLLEAERARLHKADACAEPYKKLIFKGCEDHITHLAATEFEKRLVIREVSWGRNQSVKSNRHISATALCHIVALLRSAKFKRGFRDYVRKNGGQKHANFPRHSETRYASLCILALRYVQNEGFIILFLHEMKSLLTEQDLNAIKVMLQPEIAAITRVRALYAAHCLLPLMKRAASLPPSEFKAILTTTSTKMEEIARQPEQLAHAKLDLNDNPVRGKLPQALGEFSKEVDKLLSQPAHLPLPAVTEETHSEHGDVEDDDDDDSDNDDDSHALVNQAALTFAVQVLDLEPPSKRKVATPTSQEMTRTIISDAAKAFLSSNVSTMAG